MHIRVEKRTRELKGTIKGIPIHNKCKYLGLSIYDDLNFSSET